MNLKLLNLKLTNFKGIQSLEIAFDERSPVPTLPAKQPCLTHGAGCSLVRTATTGHPSRLKPSAGTTSPSTTWTTKWKPL